MRTYVSSILFILSIASLVGLHKPLPPVVAHAGGTVSVRRDQGYAILDATTSTGVGLTFHWKLLNPNGSQPEEGWMDNPDGAVCSIHNLPYGSGHWDYELTVTDGTTTSKDTAHFSMLWGTPFPPQSPGVGFRVATSADATYFNAFNPGSVVAGRDIIILGANNGYNIGGNLTDFYSDTTGAWGAINFTNDTKIIPKAGIYGNIALNFKSTQISAINSHPIIFTNIDGQVESAEGLINNGKNIHMTGKYVPGVSGNPNWLFWDSAGGTWAYRDSRAGMYFNNRFTVLGGACFTFSGNNTDSCEADYFEAAHGGFAGIFMKENDVVASKIWTCFRGMYIHHSLVMYTDGEGNYYGSTGCDSCDFFSGVNHWQHAVPGLRMDNNLWICTGNELSQLGDLGGGTRINNNVGFMGDMRYRAPFDENQANGVQRDFRDGNIKEFNNIYIRSGDQMYNLFAQTKHRGAGDPLFDTTRNEEYNNLLLMTHCNIGNFFKLQDTLNPQLISFHDNISGMFLFDGNTLYGDARGTNTQEIIRSQIFSSNRLSYKNNIDDNTKTGGMTFFNGGGGLFDSSGNHKSSVSWPHFFNVGVSGFTTDSIFALTCFSWIDTIYATRGDEYNIIGYGKFPFVKQGVAWTYSIGDIVLWQDKIYVSLSNGNAHNMPYVGSPFWQVKTFTNQQGFTVYTPAYDLRLVSTDTYAIKGMGLVAQVTTPIHDIRYKTGGKHRGKVIKYKI